MEQMREKYESLSAFVLKDLAKARGINGVSSLKKGQIIERMLEEDAKEAEEAEKNGTAEERANSFKDDYAAVSYTHLVSARRLPLVAASLSTCDWLA